MHKAVNTLAALIMQMKLVNIIEKNNFRVNRQCVEEWRGGGGVCRQMSWLARAAIKSYFLGKWTDNFDAGGLIAYIWVINFIWCHITRTGCISVARHVCRYVCNTKWGPVNYWLLKSPSTITNMTLFGLRGSRMAISRKVPTIWWRIYVVTHALNEVTSGAISFTLVQWMFYDLL